MTLISNTTKTILISVDLSELRVAVLEEGRTVEALIERRGKGSLVGNIYKGKVDNVLPGMEAAFVDIGLPKNCFLHQDDVVLPGVDPKERRKRRIHDLLKPGQEVLVQVIKDPMGTKGARVTMELSVAGRFLVLSPQGEGSGVSRRLPDGERDRLRDVARKLEAKDVGIIVRTAAAGATEEDLERDLRFLRRLWAQVEARVPGAKAPSLVHAEADLSLRVIRDLLARNVDRVLVDSERQYRRILGWVRTTQPEFVDRIQLYTESTPLFETHGVDAAIRSTLNRRVDLPSGGYLLFDFAEAFTVIDVNTGRFVGGGGGRLEDTITRNNIESAREVVRQLRLRDIGGIIVIDFIDMAAQKNRTEVLKVLQSELERDRTKTYVVEISPLGLVEMTRQNVTEGVREVLTRTCPTCGGEGVVLSEDTMAVEAERRLRKLARATGSDAFLVKLNAKVASLLVGPGGAKLLELERDTGKFFSIETSERLPLEEVDVLSEGSREDVLGGKPTVTEGTEIKLRIDEPHMYNTTDGVGHVNAYPVVVGGAITYVGQDHKVRIERVTRAGAFASLLDAEPRGIELPPEPGGMELPEFDREVGERLEIDQRSKPRTRRKAPAKKKAEPKPVEAAADGAAADADAEAPTKPKRTRTRRKPAAEPEPATAEAAAEPAEADADGDAEAGENGAEDGAKRRRRGRRGGRGRGGSRTAAADAGADGEPSADGAAVDAEPAAEPEPPAEEKPKRAPRRRRTPAKAAVAADAPPTDAAAAASAAPDAQPEPAAVAEASAAKPEPAPQPEPAAAAPAPEPESGGERRRPSLLGKLLG
ncbi:MAG: Rne/Rng family ribonuclease [Gaiellales bacterium]